MYRHLAECVLENDNKIFISDIDKHKYDTHDIYFRRKDDTYDKEYLDTKFSEFEESNVVVNGEYHVTIPYRESKSPVKILRIEGKTVQDENNLEDIRSVGDSNGDGSYTIPVKVIGRNLFNSGNMRHYTPSNGLVLDSEGWWKFVNNTTLEHIKVFNQVIPVEPNTKYTVTIKVKGNGNTLHGPDGFIYEYDYKPTEKEITWGIATSIGASSLTENGEITRTFVTRSNTKYVKIRVDNNGQKDTSYDSITYYKDIMFNKGDYIPFEPYVEDVKRIKLPVQLESINDIKDELVVRSDNTAYITKNIRTFNLLGIQREYYAVWPQFISDTHFSFYLDLQRSFDDIPKYPTHMFKRNSGISDKFKYNDNILTSESKITGFSTRNANPNYIGFRIPYTKIGNLTLPITPGGDLSLTVQEIREWIRHNNITIKVVVTNPEIIELGKIDSLLTSSIDVSTIIIDTEISPSCIEVSAPVSTVSEISRQTESVSELEYEINQLKTLSGNTVLRGEVLDNKFAMKNSTPGYLSDIEIEGRTVRNMMNGVWKDRIIFRRPDEISHETTFTDRSMRMNIVPFIKPNTTYTVFASVIKNNISDNQSFSVVDSYKHGFISTINILLPRGFIGDFVKSFTSGPDINENTRHKMYLRTPNDDPNPGELTIANYMILEGDHTDKPMGYFKSLGSVGGESNKITIVSMDTSKDLVDIRNFTTPSSSSITKSFPISIPKGTNTLYCRIVMDDGTIYRGHDVDFRFTSDKGGLATKNNTQPINEKFVFTDGILDDVTELSFFVNENFLNKTISVIVSLNPIPKDKLYPEYNYDKVEIDLSKYGIVGGLKSLPCGVKDRIFKKNGKYYLEQNIGYELITHEDENLVLSYGDVNNDDQKTLSFQKPVNGYKYDVNINTINISSNLFDTVGKRYVDNITEDIEWVASYSSTSTSIGFRILKSRLTTPDLEGVKNWIKANPIKLQYELETPIIHELEEDLDIQTFGDNTLISFVNNSVYGKVSFNTPNNIANTVKLLMEEVDELENQYISKSNIILDSYYSADYSSYSMLMSTCDGMESRRLNNIDEELYNLLKDIIKSKKYDREKIEEKIDFFNIIDKLSYEMCDELLEMIECQFYIPEIPDFI